MQLWLRVVGLVVTLLSVFISGCGGGGDTSLGPMWVTTDVAVADVNGDGRQDVLTLAMYQIGYTDRKGHLYVYLQTSSPGVFEAPVDYAIGNYPWRVAIDDIDGDNRPDLVVTDPDEPVTAWLVLQDPAQPGRFLAAQPLITGASSYEAVIADFNGDGAPDVAVSDSRGGADRVVLRYQDATNRGTFSPQVNVTMPGDATNVAAADIDGDGLADLLAWVYTSAQGVYPPTAGLVVAYQKAGGGFELSGMIATQTGHRVERLAIADATNDGQLDLLAFETPFSSNYATQLVVVPQSATARSFDSPRTTSLGGVEGIDDAAFAQLNTDAAADAVVAGTWPESGGPYAWPIVKSRANVLLNDGNGYFVLSTTIDMPTLVNRVTAGDLDGDGRNDLVLLGGENQCLVSFQAASGTYLAPRALH